MTYSRQRHRFLRWDYWHIDPLLLSLLSLLSLVGLIILYSASNGHFAMVEKQAARMLVAFGVMLLFAQIPSRYYRAWTPAFFIITSILLVLVLVLGQRSQGAQRWLDLGFFRFQPSELMKLAMPMMMAYVFQHQLPPKLKTLALSILVLVIPVLLTTKQPDLGTAILISISGLIVIVMAGVSWQLLVSVSTLGLISAPFLWHFMHNYQKQRVITLFHPENDPLGSGYHIIQSKIALGSGGLLGKGYLHGTQSHLQFLPAHTTDFIFAVGGEEFGLLGSIAILLLFFGILCRCLYISGNAQSNFTRLLSSALGLTFFMSAVINIGMVIGILPVVGVPLPLISYGGSSMLTTMACFGILMSIHTHRKLWSS